MKRRMWMILAGVMVGAMMIGGAGTAWARPYVDAEEEAQAEAQDEQGQSNQDEQNQDEQDEAQAEDEGEGGSGSGGSGGSTTPGSGPADSCGTPHFLGFRPWYADLCSGGEIQQPSGDDELARFIWTIVLNILFDITLAVGYLAVGFIVYGGFLYITSQGDPGKALKGKKTLTSAVIGTMIAMLASIAVNTVQVVLSINGAAGLEQGYDIQQKIGDAFTWAYSAAGVVAVVFIIKGAFQYLTAQGDPGKVQTATRSIVYAVVGLVIVLLAAAITAFVMSSIGGAI